MPRPSVFEFMILHHPPKKKDPSTVLVERTTVLCGDAGECQVVAGRKIPDEYMDKLSEIEVLIRPF